MKKDFSNLERLLKKKYDIPDSELNEAARALAGFFETLLEVEIDYRDKCKLCPKITLTE